MAHSTATYCGDLDRGNACNFAGVNQRLYVLRYWFWVGGGIMALSAVGVLRVMISSVLFLLLALADLDV